MNDSLTGRRRELASLQSELMALSDRLTQLEWASLRRSRSAGAAASAGRLAKHDVGELKEARMASYVAAGLAKMRLGQ
jgi:hypothetical protein